MANSIQTMNKQGSNTQIELPEKSPLIFIPTFNERENAQRLYKEIRALNIPLDILFLDDNSPDGTGELLEQLTQTDPHLFVMHRTGKLGVGSAHFDGIHWAYEHHYPTLITMDCDFTHPPKYILDILKQKDHADIVIGSRYLMKNSLSGWNPLRKLLTWTGHALTHALLGMKYDATTGFRLYRLDHIPMHTFKLVHSKGYSFFFESLFVLHFNHFKIYEIPMDLPPRTYGHSKMDLREVRRSLGLLMTIYFTTLTNEERYRLSEQVAEKSVNNQVLDEQGWDDYWKDQKSSSGVVYDVIAAFYRKFIIKRTLNFFISKYFPKGSNLLHAGCGSGQVDIDIARLVSITGLDISLNALNFYKRSNPKSTVLHGSIFAIPLPDKSLDGIYNLGVMEHFDTSDIQKILEEFHRVLKNDGKMVIFWPPEFGASVLFLKGAKWFLENIMGKTNVKFHPDEITRVQSKKQVTAIFAKANFKIVSYYFGLKDFFTYSIIIVEKNMSKTLQKTSSREISMPVNELIPLVPHQRNHANVPTLSMHP